MLGQPGLYGWMAVGGVVVAHHVQRDSGVRFGDQLEEGQELLVAMPGKAGVRGDAPGGDLQRGEQGRGAMADVVVGAPFGLAEADRQQRAVRSRAWIWDFSSIQTTTALAGGSR